MTIKKYQFYFFTEYVNEMNKVDELFALAKKIWRASYGALDIEIPVYEISERTYWITTTDINEWRLIPIFTALLADHYDREAFQVGKTCVTQEHLGSHFNINCM